MKNDKKPGTKRLQLYDISKAGRGVAKSEAEMAPGMKRFFVSLKNNIWKLVGVNIFYVVGNFPLIFLIMAIAGVSQKDVQIPLSDLFSNLFALLTPQTAVTPADMSAFALEGLMHNTMAPTALTYVFYALSALTLVTFGLVNTGTAYILRNMARGEPIFVWQDFWSTVKKNKKQGILFGILDLAICGILIYNVFQMISGTSKFLVSMLFWGNIIVLLAWFFIRYYIYLQIVTFNLKGFKIIKNAMIFSLLGFKRNVVAALGILLVTAILVLFLLGTGGLLVPIAIAAPLAILFAIFGYMKVFAAYFKIKEYMIDPYYAEHPQERPAPVSTDEDEPIMHDDVKPAEK